ncbi:hypothetical protein MPC4_60151 [Methylocella tundrae]|uniref:Uncharacterized protein n=1 Tax=Methylocella tundrae TaxID=227605 RepID=A0A8B6MAY3_METTU|nr:hypothetical protein MPC4_60151 [Methylocella tundrae]
MRRRTTNLQERDPDCCAADECRDNVSPRNTRTLKRTAAARHFVSTQLIYHMYLFWHECCGHFVGGAVTNKNIQRCASSRTELEPAYGETSESGHATGCSNRA